MPSVCSCRSTETFHGTFTFTASSNRASPASPPTAYRTDGQIRSATSDRGAYEEYRNHIDVTADSVSAMQICVEDLQRFGEMKPTQILFFISEQPGDNPPTRPAFRGRSCRKREERLGFARSESSLSQSLRAEAMYIYRKDGYSSAKLFDLEIGTGVRCSGSISAA